MFNAYSAVDFPAVRGIVVRLYIPTIWGRWSNKPPRYTLRVEDNAEGPFKVVDAGNVVNLTPGQEYDIAGSFVLYSNDMRPEGAKFTVTFRPNIADNSLYASLFDNGTCNRESHTYWPNGDMRQVVQTQPDDSQA